VPARVLIVDDDAAFRDMASDLLTGAGYTVAGTVGTIADARAAIAGDRPEALLLDVNLPDGTGVDLAEELCVGQPHLRILLTSSDDRWAESVIKRRCARAAFLAKTELAVADLVPLLGEP
jgi:DNA-binding NtrC family response regulator